MDVRLCHRDGEGLLYAPCREHKPQRPRLRGPVGVGLLGPVHRLGGEDRPVDAQRHLCRQRRGVVYGEGDLDGCVLGSRGLVEAAGDDHGVVSLDQGDELEIELVAADGLSADLRLKVHPQAVGSVGLGRDGVRHLPPGDGGGLGADLRTVQDEVDGLGHRPGGGVRERNGPGVGLGRVEDGADGQHHHGDGEVDGPVVAVDVGHLDPDHIGACGEIAGNVGGHLSLTDLHARLDRSVDGHPQGAVARWQLVLNGGPGDGNRAGPAAGNGGGQPAGGIGHGQHSVVPAAPASASAGKGADGPRHHGTVGCKIQIAGIHIGVVDLAGQRQGGFSVCLFQDVHIVGDLSGSVFSVHRRRDRLGRSFLEGSHLRPPGVILLPGGDDLFRVVLHVVQLPDFRFRRYGISIQRSLFYVEDEVCGGQMLLTLPEGQFKKLFSCNGCKLFVTLYGDFCRRNVNRCIYRVTVPVALRAPDCRRGVFLKGKFPTGGIQGKDKGKITVILRYRDDNGDVAVDNIQKISLRNHVATSLLRDLAQHPLIDFCNALVDFFIQHNNGVSCVALDQIPVIINNGIGK